MTDTDPEPAGHADRPKATICVTLNEQITVPGPTHDPNQFTVFRCVEYSERDDWFEFFGVRSPDGATIRVAKDNVRSIAYLPDHTPS